MNNLKEKEDTKPTKGDLVTANNKQWLKQICLEVLSIEKMITLTCLRLKL